MQKPIWLIEKHAFFDEEIEPLIEEIKSQGMRYDLKTFSPTLRGNDVNLYSPDAVQDLYPERSCVIFYGSIHTGRTISRVAPWVPGTIANFDSFKCSNYYAYWGEHLLNQDYVILPASELLRRRNEIRDQLGHISPTNSSLFVRPDDGCKSFGGHCISEQDFKAEFLLQYARPNSLIVACSPKNLNKEWRVVICDRKAIAGCQYKENDLLSTNQEVPDEVFEKANEIAASDWQPDRVYTLDLTNWKDEIRLIEANSFSCAGLYCCDMEPVVREVSRVAVEEWKNIYEI